MVKFRDFVKDDVIEKINKTKKEEVKEVKPSKKIKKTKEEVKEEVKEKYSTFVGFGVGKVYLKRVFDYIRSWLIRYNIQYEALSPYLTIGYVNNKVEDKGSLINEVKKINKNIKIKAKDVLITEGDNSKDYIIVVFEENKELFNSLKKGFKKYGKNLNPLSVVKLFEIEKGSFNSKLFEDMIYSIPPMPEIKIGKIGFLVRRIK